MAGYDGWSMSNNARAAYASGEMPKSKWTKALIIDRIAEEHGEAAAEKAKKHTAAFLRSHFLECSSWHHTGKYYNRTDFYDYAYGMETEEALRILALVEVKEVKAPTTWQPCMATWIEWTGTRRHPKAEDVTAFGRTDGKKFESADGWTTKRCSGHYITIITMDDESAKKAFKEAFRLRTSHRYGKWLETGSIK